MLSIHRFTFNPYEENTYLLIDDEGHCAIVDPGCYTQTEQEALTQYITDQNLKVTLLLNTHGHIDHMLGNRFVVDTYKVPFWTHQNVIPELEATQAYGAMFGLNPAPSPMPDRTIEGGSTIEIGAESLEVYFTPGHSPGHISFFHRPSGQLFSGDVLFKGSIGRWDLPGGNYETLIHSIFTALLPLGTDVIVYPGHGPETTLGQEMQHNPYILQHQAEFPSQP